MVKAEKSYLKDSRQFIDKLRNIKIERDILVTIDVNSLYIIVVLEDVINSVEWALHKQTNMGAWFGHGDMVE